MSTIPKNQNIQDISSNYEILDNMRTAILILDADFRYIYTNTSAIDLLGSSTAIKEITELRCENISLSMYLNNIKEDSQPVMLRDLKFKNFDRIERIVDCNISSYYNNDVKYILLELNETGRLYNISLDQNLIDQQKATREMVKGLSHEIKNPLGGIMGAAQLLDRTLTDESQAKFTKIIRKESERLLKLINAMSSPLPSVDKDMINIHEVTEHVTELFKYDVDNLGVNFVKDYDPSIPQLYLDKNQIIQALINIIRNAIQAINKDGKIVIKTRPLLKYTIGDIRHDLVIKIDVIDNGVGIPEKKLKEIFYPMVTTKNDGMGLGLTIAQSIIIQNKGIIECKSKNKETVFSIIIPWSSE
ncbi:MAG: GHKL domain-containing protein [Gammaproteobacteria bacterium]|jgi:two-component system, NtrC family, nitrogen regulation sensor histidine kinase GlnL|nr:GHKL domain-containing protein [Gammaproteobacteria bacterium]MBT5644156.1 GHKL domain-containing protein [Gammaproteobacteria bacterium]MBT5863211.1 GHKL domain-containing protein [Gammaproteobacteria bacterium]MBT6734262.1 GHKL domain-containing protein [Gammaproteobacteria bacterium]MBT7236862.1 GHKL domain-containing protein [Gammaproteobacteria bacterium]|tara:strand:- start:1153 stop:2229 length:1077 start_codon:yes stop_codon:yes gene_type:complete